MRVRRASAIVCHWQDGEFVVENYRDHSVQAMDPFAAVLLGALTDWTDTAEVSAAFPDHDAESVRDAVDQLRECGLLITEDADTDDADRRVGTAWPLWGQAARHLHFGTRDVEHADDTPQSRAELVASIDGPLPPLTKSYPDAPRIPLPRQPPPHPSGGGFFDVLHRRRTHRAFLDTAVSLADFSVLMATVFGPVAFLDADVFGTLMQRTSPCGGSRHEIEAYVIVRHIDGVPPGVYHYQAIEHSLEWLGQRPEDHWDRLTALAVNQTGIGQAAFAVVLTAVVDRIQVKYRGARAYRVMLLNAGHLGQTFALTATALGLGPFQTGAFADSDLEHLIGVDGVDETVLYLFSAGHPAQDRESSHPRLDDPASPARLRLS